MFNNLDKAEIEEVVYPASLDPHKLIEFVDTMDDELLTSITKQYLYNDNKVDRNNFLDIY